MRKLTPELLDHLPHDDPAAIRSRADLRRINRFMGNEAWIISQIPEDTKTITEIGSGDGNLLSKIANRFPQASLRAFDLAPRPDGLPEKIEWLRGDILENVPKTSGGILIANLILHHFTDPQLERLAPWFASFGTIIANEPLRSPLPLFLGKLAYPFINRVTRHDMRVSIESGFVPGELPKLLGLERNGFSITESSTWRGSLRVLASYT